MNEKINILVVEDDGDINNLLNKILNNHGYNAVSAYSGTEARMCTRNYDFQLVLLDLMLPGISGEEFITEVRKIKTMPIIVISAKSSQEAKIEVLRLGADDFITKPFDINEVLARVEAQLRRYMVFSNSGEDKNILKHKGLVLDRDKIEVTLNGQVLQLTGREFTILELLMSYPSKVFTKANLFEHVWEDKYFGDDNTVNVHLSNLRSKLAKIEPKEEYIHTVWGIGYKLSDKT